MYTQDMNDKPLHIRPQMKASGSTSNLSMSKALQGACQIPCARAQGSTEDCTCTSDAGTQALSRLTSFPDEFCAVAMAEFILGIVKVDMGK